MLDLDLLVGAVKARILKMSAIAGHTSNMNQITDNIWMGGLNNPKKIMSEGFKAVLDLREKDDLKYKKSLEGYGIHYLNIKINDGEGAPPHILKSIAEWLQEKKESGQKTLVHCNLGRGRGALATAVHLIRQGETVEEALSLIKNRRSVTYVNEKQLKALKVFFEYVRPGRDE